jgi:predicted small lipoprotein YifL
MVLEFIRIWKMALSLQKPAFHIALLLAVVMAVSSCGRRGDLQAPGSVQAESIEETAQSQPEAPVEEKEDKPFILDGLL